MKWILLVYIMTTNPVMESLEQRRMEFPMDYAKCELIATHINYIQNYKYITPFPFVKSLHYEHIRNDDTVLARCVYTDPDNIPEWVDDFLK